jgi:hypothetical protein
MRSWSIGLRVRLPGVRIPVEGLPHHDVDAGGWLGRQRSHGNGWRRRTDRNHEQHDDHDE